MKSKRAEEFIRNSAFSAIQLPGEVMYSIHMNVEGKLLRRKSAEKAVELAEQDAEERHKEAIEEVKKRAVRAHIESCYSVVPSDCDVKLCTECKRTNYFIQKLNEQ